MIVEYLEDLITRYQADMQCGLCWKFVFARRDYANNLKEVDGEECCAHFMLLGYSASVGFKQNPFGVEREYCDYSFSAFVGIKSTLQEQFYNEGDADSSESKYTLYVKPLEECIGCMESDICDSLVNLGTSAEIISWSYDLKMNYMDANYDGLMIKGTYRVWS